MNGSVPVQTGQYPGGNGGPIYTFYGTASKTVPDQTFNVWDFYRASDGAAPDNMISRAIAAGLSAGGAVVTFPPMQYLLNTTIVNNAPNVVLRGFGPGTWLTPAPGFTGSQIISLGANYTGVRDMTLAYSSNIGQNSSANPAADGIVVTGARSARLSGLEMRGINGWAIKVIGTAAASCFDARVRDIHVLHCASGGYTIADAAQSYGGQQYWTNCNFEIVDSGDGMYIQDIADIWLTNYGAAAAQGSFTNSALHLAGAASAIHILAPDIGSFPGPANAPIALIEAISTRVPTDIDWTGGVSQGGTTTLRITDGKNLTFQGVTFKSASGDGVQVTNLSDVAKFSQCTWKTNGTGGGTCYDINLSNTSNVVTIAGGACESPIGAGAGFVTASLNDSGHLAVATGVTLRSAGPIAASGSPATVRYCPGYNPVKSLSPQPAIPASGVAYGTQPVDCTVYIHGGTISNIQINGAATGLNTGSFRILAGEVLTITYSVAPSAVVWFGD